MADEQGMLVHQFELGPWDNFIYLIADRSTGKCAVVDPAWHAPTIFSEVESLGLTLDRILCTHSHFDHVNQVDAVLARYDIPVHMLSEEVEWSGFRCENLVRQRPGDTIRFGDAAEVTLMHTPGHTPGSTTFRLHDAVVTGDTLFVNGCGRCDFVGGDPEVMYQTLHELVDKLPGHTTVFPGHNYGPTRSTTVREQREHNPFILKPTLNEFVSHRMEGKTPNSPLPPAPERWTPSD